MKTQNTPENKARFFAQYWGQKVLISTIIKGEVLNLNSIDFNTKYFFTDFLLLTPLSQITDEDAVEITSLIYPYSIEEDYEKIITFRNIFEYEETVCQSYTLVEKGISTLRSKGYALPWMDLSVEDLIEYGWIKLK